MQQNKVKTSLNYYWNVCETLVFGSKNLIRFASLIWQIRMDKIEQNNHASQDSHSIKFYKLYGNSHCALSCSFVHQNSLSCFFVVCFSETDLFPCSNHVKKWGYEHVTTGIVVDIFIDIQLKSICKIKIILTSI